MADYYDLGDHRRAITSSSDEACEWFNRGLLWTYGFNHREGVKCFETALTYDPDCAMAYWGIAYASGPNYNKQWERCDPVELADTFQRTYDATQKALALIDNASPLEQMLIRTLTVRYPSPEPVDDFQRLYDDYADAMRAVYQAYPDDMDVVALFADALMCRTPWQLWDLASGTPTPGASTDEATEVLERALATSEGRRHPAVVHMHIHLMEMSPHPERALRSADLLRGMVPEAGHLEHMPTHIDVLCGHYHNVVASNHDAILADGKYVEREGKVNYYTLYRVHNYHFKIYGAMFLGQYETALQTSEEMIDTIPRELLEWQSPPMADWLEGFIPMKMHVLIRFGKWDEILSEPFPDDPELFSVTTAMMHYARGVAYSATGQVAEAERERTLFNEAVARVPDTRYIHNNSYLDIFEIAREMLNGELEYRKGNYDVAYAHLREAIEREDGLEYDEPWAWMQPSRHAHGALLLEQGHVEEAADVYRADLGLDGCLPRAYQHPENVWSLHGYHECLMRLGRLDEAAIIKQRLDRAAARADVPIQASCYCRMSQVA